MVNMNKVAHDPGKRKTAIARATIREGKGNVRVNSIPLEVYTPELARFKIKEPIVLAAENNIDLNAIDIEVNVHGGGVMGQADAAASSIARALSDFVGDELLKVYMGYNRILIAGDHRQTEPHKPSRSSQGPRAGKQKSYR